MIISILQKLDQYDSLDYKILFFIIFLEFLFLSSIYFVGYKLLIKRFRKKVDKDFKEAFLGDRDSFQNEMSKNRFNGLKKENW